MVFINKIVFPHFMVKLDKFYKIQFTFTILVKNNSDN